jgi:Zn-dependent protease with chaperone function
LKSQIGLSNFGSQPAFNTIIYDPLLTNLSKDSIRFFLLHEEGHHIKGFGGYYLKTILCICGVLLMSLTIILPTICVLVLRISIYEWLALATLFLFGAFLTIFSTSISANSLKWDEYDSDKFAAGLLRDKYS